MESLLMKMPKSKNGLCHGTPSFTNMEQPVYDWITYCRKKLVCSYPRWYMAANYEAFKEWKVSKQQFLKNRLLSALDSSKRYDLNLPQLTKVALYCYLIWRKNFLNFKDLLSKRERISLWIIADWEQGCNSSVFVHENRCVTQKGGKVVFIKTTG